MTVDYLLTADGQRVYMTNGVRLLCTARHPVTQEMVVLPEVKSHHTFEELPRESACKLGGAANSEGDSLPPISQVRVETSVVVVNKGW